MATNAEDESVDFTLAKYPMLRPLFGMVFLESLGMALSAPVIPFFITEEMGASIFELGIAGSAFASTQILGAAVFGRCSDAYGRWPVVVGAFLWTAIGCIVTAHVTTFTQLLVARVITGISGGTWPICQSYLLDVVEYKDRGNYMGLLAAVFASAWVVGPASATGLLTYHLVTRRSIFTLSGVICLLGAAIGGVWLKESLGRDQRRPFGGRRTPREEEPAAFEAQGRQVSAKEESDFDAVNIGLFSLWWVRFFLAICQFIAYTVYAPLLEDTFGFGARALGIMLSVGGVLAVIIQGVVFGKVVRAFGRHHTLALGCFLIAFAACLLPSMTIFTVHCLIMLFFVVGEGYVEPGTPIVIATYVSSRHLGFANGWGSAFRGLAAIFAPLLGGFLYDRCAGCAFLFAGASAFIAGCLVMIAKRYGTEYEVEDTDGAATETTKLI